MHLYINQKVAELKGEVLYKESWVSGKYKTEKRTNTTENHTIIISFKNKMYEIHNHIEFTRVESSRVTVSYQMTADYVAMMYTIYHLISTWLFKRHFKKAIGHSGYNTSTTSEKIQKKAFPAPFSHEFNKSKHWSF